MYVRLTLPNDYGSEEDHEKLVQWLAEYLDIEREEIDSDDVDKLWDYIFDRCIENPDIVEVEDFGYVVRCRAVHRDALPPVWYEELSKEDLEEMGIEADE